MIPPSHRAQAAEAAELAAGEALELPADLDYAALQLSAEDAEKLAGGRPATLAAAQRIPGAPVLFQDLLIGPARE